MGHIYQISTAFDGNVCLILFAAPLGNIFSLVLREVLPLLTLNAGAVSVTATTSCLISLNQSVRKDDTTTE